MKKYEIYRMAILIQIMAKTLGIQEMTIITALQGHCVDEEDAGSIRRMIEVLDED